MSLEAYHMPEKTCPVCGHKGRRKSYGGGVMGCAKCGATLYIYRMHARSKNRAYSIYVTAEPHIKDVAEHVADWIRRQPGREEFRWANKQHMLQEFGAAGLLLKYCEGDQDLAFAVVDTLFDSKKRSEGKIRGWKPISVCNIIAKQNLDRLAAAMAYAKQKTGYQRNDLTELKQEEMF